MEKIYVTVRPRPLSLEDAKTSIWRISGNSISISNQSTKFEFDQIFGEDCKNVEVYEARTKDIVLAAVGGFNGTVFAYGQTSSGKTHTMRGSTVEPGVIPLAVRDLFHIIQEDVDREFLLRMSYMEIYNEEVNDLLAPEHRKLQIHESIERGIFVAGLREEIVATPEQVLDLMEFGESHRHIGETNMNVYSSRSHTIFRMIIESRVITEDDGVGSSCDAVRVSVLNLVDLAGSERAAKTGAEGVRLKEGSHINKSLMTLGTVIKRLSEGAESQGGHVPYRDSKLTRILQPSLGGNANTAIICNITLAQIHADETKSSLQFASRALRVTNCARVNEILTDAALLKRQKREIEELQAKLQGSRSEHFEEEILNLRNTLLQSELERERIALELQEEKKAQALRERRLQEQDKKIKNLSSMVLNSNVDEKRFTHKKDKRRDTWCPSAILRETLEEASLTTQWKASIGEPVKPERDMGLPCPFEELVNENEVSRDIPQDSNNDLSEDCILPDARSLLNVTNRRKTYMKKKNSLENHELLEMKEECEDLFLEETQRKAKDIEIGFLTEQLVDTEHHSDGRNIDFSKCQLDKSALHGDKSLTLRESEAILVIKQLQEQVKMLEKEKTSIQQCLDNVIELATEQNLSAKEKYEEVFQELLDARKATKVVDESLPLEASTKTIEEDYVDSTMELLMEVQGIEMEVQSSRNAVECVSSVVDELFQSFSVASNDLKSFICQNSAQLKSIISDNEKIHSCMRKKVDDLENDKSVLHNQSIDLHKQIQELRLNLQESEKILMERCQQHDLEKAEFLSEFGNLEKEITCLSSCSLAKEKETLRKELEKTKVKLKETESKLRTVIQEKTKLESEKAQAEREIKHLHGQKNLLERDICKRDSLAGRRRESKAFDSNKTKGHAGQSEQIVQGEYKKLEVLAFEMETTIASLEEDLAAVNVEKEEAFCRNEILSSELESTLDKLSTTNLELKMLQEEVSSMKIRLDESESLCQKMEISIKLLSDEKEELAMKLTDALLELDEEKAIWSAKEKASIESITEKVKLSNAEITLLSKEISEVRGALESCREESKVLREKLNLSEENAEWERNCSMEKSSEIDQLRHDLKTSESECEKCEDILKSKSEMLELEHRHACDEMDKLQKELCVLNKERDDLLLQIKEMDGGLNHSTNFEDLKNQLLIMSKERDQLLRQYEEQQKLMIEVEILKKENDDLLGKARAEVEELKRRISSREIKIHNDTIDTNNEKAKLKMRLRSTQAKLDAFRGRYRETIDEMGLMNRKYDEASAKLKEQLASYGREVLHLKKQLAMKG